MAINNTLSSLTHANSTPAYILPKKKNTSTSTSSLQGLMTNSLGTPTPLARSLGTTTTKPAASQPAAQSYSTPQSFSAPQSPANTSSLQSQLVAAQAELQKRQTQQNTPAQAPAPAGSRGLFPDVLSSLQKLGTDSNEDVKRAQAEYQQSVENLRKFKESVADKGAAIKMDPVSARVMQGREAALQQANAEKLAAYQAAVGQTQEGVSQAQTQQQLSQQALQTAAQFAAPVQVAPGSSLFSPMGGEAIAGGLGGYVNYQTAEQVMGLISQYPDSGYQYNPSLSPQQNLQAAQSAIQRSPTYQRTTFGVPGAQTVVGAAQTQVAQQGYSESVQTYNTLYAQFQNAESLGDNVINIMKSEGINPTDARYANQSIQQVRRQLSSAQQQKFDTALQEARNAFGNLVATGGGVTPTGAESAYETLLSPNASLGAISAAIEQLKNAGNIRLNAEYQRVQNYYNQLNTASYGGGNSSGGGSIYNF